MKRAIWVHQWNQLGEQSIPDIAATLKPRGIDTVYIKAMDGPYWMSEVYNHSLVPSSPSSMSDLVTAFKLNDLQLLPWVVNRFNGSEALAHIACGNAAGGLVVDFEYKYAGFWEGALIECYGYFNHCRRAVVDGLWVAVAPDPRQVLRDYPRALIEALSAYLPQTYWTDFQRPVLEVLSQAYTSLDGLGPIEPIFPYNSTVEAMIVGIEHAVYMQSQGVSLWRMGSANGTQLDTFATRVAGEATTPIDPNVALVNALAYVCDDLGDRIHKLTRSTRIRDAVTEMRRVREQMIGPRP